MNITETKTKVLNVADLRPNEGQITGVPANPRYISETEFQALCKSIQEDNLTGVLQMKVFRWDDEWVVLDGNMRLRALQELGIEKVQCLIVPEDADTMTLKKIVISSNSAFGHYDMDALANEWNDCPLDEWGVDLPAIPDESKVAGLFEDAQESNRSGEQAISVIVPTQYDGNIEDIKATIRIALQEWDGCKVR